MSFTTKNYRYHCGGITITMSLLLLILSLGATVYTANSNLLEAKIAQAHYRKSQAYLAAESGIQYALIHLNLNPEHLGRIDHTSSDRFSVEVTAITDPLDAEFSIIENPNIRFRRITSTGFSDDIASRTSRHSTQSITLSVIRRPIIKLPLAAITMAGTLTVDADLKVGANPDGGGVDIPLSIWSNSTVGINGTGATCDLVKFDDPTPQSCHDYFYSNRYSLGPDIMANDPTMPTDLMLYLFGYESTHANHLKTTSKQVLTNCNDLSETSSGFFWVSGNCRANASIGSESNPVILLIEDGALRLDGNFRVHGIVYLHHSDSSLPAPTISMFGAASIHGALISNGNIDVSIGRLEVRYQPNILTIISNGAHPLFSSIHTIPGSWKDF